jgi:hypothetical protein
MLIRLILFGVVTIFVQIPDGAPAAVDQGANGAPAAGHD